LDKRKGIVFIVYDFSRFFSSIDRKLVGQSLSTLSAASLQYLSACGRCHSLTETVYFASLSLFGLIRSFHNTFSCIWFLSFSFFGRYRGSPHNNQLIISQNPKLRQAILPDFSFLSVNLSLFFTLF